MQFKAHFKLEFDIKTNSDNMKEILDVIVKNIGNELNEKIKDETSISVLPTITKIEV